VEVEGDGSRRSHTSGVSVGGESTGVVDDIVGVEVLELSGRGTDKHVAHEESMVGTRADDADLDAVTLIPAGVTVNDVDAVTGVQVVDGTFTVDEPDL
jgi:hypothetical protein